MGSRSKYVKRPKKQESSDHIIVSRELYKQLNEVFIPSTKENSVKLV